MRTITLHGELAKEFGRTHKFDVQSAAESVRALCANFPKFRSRLLTAQTRGVAYRVISDNEIIGREELRHPFSREIEFVPMILGASTSSGKIVVGAVLIAAAVVIGVGTGGTAGAVSGVLLNVGVGFIAGGILQAITPVPHSPDAPSEDDKSTPSYLFNGPVNTTAQRQPVPIGYGRLLVGSAEISAGISTDSGPGSSLSSSIITPTLSTAADDVTQPNYAPGSNQVV